MLLFSLKGNMPFYRLKRGISTIFHLCLIFCLIIEQKPKAIASNVCWALFTSFSLFVYSIYGNDQIVL